jgi:NitT/TauT family transport system ATP-binding protein
VPTTFPKCNPTEMMGLLVLLNSHNGSEDVALLADDLDLEIDEIFPALEFAEVLQLVKVTDGRATFTELGKKLMGGSIRERKTTIRDQLRKTTLFKTLLRALENAPEHALSDEDLGQIVSFTTAPADDAVQNIVNWGRYADLFRYDSAEQRLILTRRALSGKTGSGPSRPPSPPAAPGEGSSTTSKGTTSASSGSELRTSAALTATS